MNNIVFDFFTKTVDLLECFYFFSMFYGFYNWSCAIKRKDKKFITSIFSYNWFFIIAIVILFFIACIGIFFLFNFFESSELLLLDTISASISILAQILLCYRIIESWILWLIVDIAYSYMYFKGGLPLHGILFFMYVILAVVGYTRWLKLMHRE